MAERELTPAELAELERLHAKLVAEGKVRPHDSEGGKHRRGE